MNDEQIIMHMVQSYRGSRKRFQMQLWHFSTVEWNERCLIWLSRLYVFIKGQFTRANKSGKAAFCHIISLNWLVRCWLRKVIDGSFVPVLLWYWGVRQSDVGFESIKIDIGTGLGIVRLSAEKINDQIRRATQWWFWFTDVLRRMSAFELYVGETWYWRFFFQRHFLIYLFK